MAKKMAAKKTKVVPEAGETEYVVINPAQVEKIEEAILKAASKAGFNVRPGVDFWAKATSCLAMALMVADMSNRTPMDQMAKEAVEAGHWLAKRFKEGK